MATEFDNSLHWGLFLTGTTLTSETGKYVRVSELVLSALRAAGVFSNMVDGIVAPATDKLWLDKNVDPAVLKEWDATGASWVPMSYGRLFGRAAVDKLTVTGGTGNAVVVSQPVGFQANRLYLMTPTQNNSAAATITVAGVGSYGVKYGNGADIGATEFSAGRQAVLFFTGVRFEVVFPLGGLSSAVLAAQASADAAAASASSSSTSASNAATSATNAANSATASANSATAAANAVAALPYNFSTTTTDADPGAGIFRLNNVAPGSATAAYIDNVDADGVSATGVLDNWDDSTSTVRGVLTIRSKANATIRHTYNVTGSVVDGTGYRKLTLAYIGGSGALTNGAGHWLIFNRTGDNASGDVTGPGSSTNNGFARFNGTTGKVIKDSAAVIAIADGGTGQGTAANAFNALKQAASDTATGVVELATGPEVATGTDAARVPSVLTMGSHQGVAKAWINFNGDGTVAIRDSYNVTSITDNGTGDYTLNFTIALANANYAVVGCGRDDAGAGSYNVVCITSITQLTTSCQIRTRAVNNTAIDSDTVGLAIFGD
ncbi:hypothetical protein [Aminobacter ciceronei]|uniref:Tail fiber protein n=1 Tax=Aminobacter ciceronei TaxID=150723 RepID=A0ABR6C2I1_9HYPH|nr:hypothetical protein [Aminobacter ciceronei]MBA8905500.1 hypothetical protein [Aminobacter ciceronei]MBA9019201.1 hypothetical protein [Aminobacter ciceronei]